MKFAADFIVKQVGELFAITETHLKQLLINRGTSWSLIEITMNGRRKKFGANAAAEFELIQFIVKTLSRISQKIVCPAIMALPAVEKDDMAD